MFQVFSADILNNVCKFTKKSFHDCVLIAAKGEILYECTKYQSLSLEKYRLHIWQSADYCVSLPKVTRISL